IVHHMFQIIANKEGLPYEKSNPLSFIERLPDHLHRLLRAMSQTTFSLTRWRGGKSRDNFQNGFEVYMDSRTLPYINHAAFENILKQKTLGLNVKYEILSFSQGYETPLDIEFLSLFE